MDTKTREQKARRQAAKFGYAIHKSRIDGTFYIFDRDVGVVVAPVDVQSNGSGGFALDEVEDYLREEATTSIADRLESVGTVRT
jgi:hypothetical protein